MSLDASLSDFQLFQMDLKESNTTPSTDFTSLVLMIQEWIETRFGLTGSYKRVTVNSIVFSGILQSQKSMSGRTSSSSHQLNLKVIESTNHTSVWLKRKEELETTESMQTRSSQESRRQDTTSSNSWQSRSTLTTVALDTTLPDTTPSHLDKVTQTTSST